ncbi:MAG TPA: hypothetical protein VFG14_15770 [Chthoniobacteraceae bacterium]|jgi:hypothetical protein|nr:hypothetical protein [Chthoniobacteraceae bacterium]
MNRPFPILSVLALTTAALFFFISAPVWHSVVRHQLGSAEYNSEDAREDAGRFASVTAVARATLTAAGGALIGVVLCLIAHRRREAAPVLRGIAAVTNLLLIGYALYFFLRLAT